jgi:hypothetical protein
VVGACAVHHPLRTTFTWAAARSSRLTPARHRPHPSTRCVAAVPSVAEVEAEFWRIVEDPREVVESLYGQDLDSGHHGSGFPLPEWRRCVRASVLGGRVGGVLGWEGAWS